MTSPAQGDRPLVVVAEPLDPACLDWLAQRCEVAPIAALHGAQGLIVRTATRVNADLLSRAPRLRVVGRAGVGVDHIDLDACAARGIAVVHTPDANTDAVVEFVFAEILDRLRPRPAAPPGLDADSWEQRRDAATRSTPAQLADLTLGVLGFGRIGSRVARVGAAFNMRVRFNDLLDIPPSGRAGASPVSFEALLSSADVLTIHVDGRSSNRRLVDADACEMLKPGVLLINTSRGFVIDAHALSAHLRRDAAAYAVLDVHESEPIDGANPLVDLPNARLTPHIAAATISAKRNMSWVVRDVWRVLNGGRPHHPASAS